MSPNQRLSDAWTALDPNNTPTVVPLIDLLDELAKTLAREDSFRVQVGTSVPPLWPILQEIWTLAAIPSPDGDDNIRNLRLSVARFTRNLVAAVPYNQQQAFVNELPIRTLIQHYTSYLHTQNEISLPVTRMLIQALSNIVTSNDELAQKLWPMYMDLPMENLILIRLLGTSDGATLMSTMVLVLNCIHSDRTQVEQLVFGRSGPRLSISLLDQIADSFEADEASAKSQVFDLGYNIFTRLFEEGLAPDLYLQISMPGEVVTPHQTTLLKLLDSYLHTQPQHNSETLTPSRRHDLTRLFVREFFTLAAYAQNAICRSLGITQIDTRSEPPKETPQSLKDRAFSFSPNDTGDDSSSRLFPMEELDLILPKVCEALVLVTQCITSLTLHAVDDKNGKNGKEAESPHTINLSSADPDSLKVYVANAHSTSDMGFVESLLDTLRLVDRFLPRITFGKDSHSAFKQQPSGEAAESPDENIRTAGAKPQSDDPKGFMYLKRDLIRLLGILAYRSKGVQDRVRLREGIPIVLNMCVIDERNPYLREHAIFALRNILENNVENQAAVNEIQPVREWDESGVLSERRDL